MCIMKTKLISVLCAGVLIVFGLTGCTTTRASKSSEDASKTRIISTKLGDVEVPANPQRVVSSYVEGDLVALGIVPVAGIAPYEFKGSAFYEEVKDITLIESLEPETVMAQKPDLIVVISEDDVEKMSKIAPTVFVPFTELSMEERITFLGQVVNKEEEAKKLIKDFNYKLADAKKKLDKTGILNKKVSIFEGADESGSIYVYGDKWGRGGDLIYNKLGFKAPDVIQNEIINGEQYRDISLEVLPEYSGDYIIFASDIPNSLKGNSVWENIPAVKENHIITIDEKLFYYMDIYSANVQLDYFVEKFLSVSKSN
ncbi:ABC transporter substrate-binding protein [Clostridium gasigenes]|nr:ABC transporter substrate-binding protein [Clostridium gasigenes]